MRFVSPGKFRIGFAANMFRTGQAGVCCERLITPQVFAGEIFPENSLRNAVENGLQHLSRAIQLFCYGSMRGEPLVNDGAKHREPEKQKRHDDDAGDAEGRDAYGVRIIHGRRGASETRGCHSCVVHGCDGDSHDNSTRYFPVGYGSDRSAKPKRKRQRH